MHKELWGRPMSSSGRLLADDDKKNNEVKSFDYILAEI
jgi:hypothetical protein